ncbi:amidohydrolase family protein [Saccharothrix violaceirubra]|uniref:Tol biopolymer transport system component/imidazolonepropionase-like amidohydrolase n=1 Tax=Saccharothrix violaceirubra TaxID=413306 RepID=A0A7W7T743_9PSEU|nr:amidohydrolase family protein [Saccharothrix violaceirubra]MBB4967257.1 Tol biopolymer transport system component/imidazolonepropionase-like amidohydrolase [Saccharothrix violaceirubra]
MRTPNHRRFGGLALALVLVAAVPVTSPATAAAPKRTTTDITVTEGTNLAVAASPRDGTLVFDLQGRLFSVPAAGGTAKPLADDFLDPFWPTFSPDGSTIALQSFADGRSRIATIKADGTGVRQLSDNPFDAVQPAWSPDGRKIAYATGPDGAKDLWQIDARTGAMELLSTDPVDESAPTYTPDGRQLTYLAGNEVRNLDLASRTRTVVIPGGQGFLAAPSWSPDGKRLAVLRTGQGGRTLSVWENGALRPVAAFADVFPFPARWTSKDELVYGADGKIYRTNVASGATVGVPFAATLTIARDDYPRKKYDFDSRDPQRVKGIVSPALSPDGRTVAFKALNDLYLLPVGGKAKALTDDDFYETDPAWSRDGKLLAYASDKGGSVDLYVRDLATNAERRVTSGTGSEIGPAFSPDGRRLAYQDNNAQTWTVDLASGMQTRVLGPQNAPGRVSWSGDGTALVQAVSVNNANHILVLDVASGAQQTFSPGTSISTRGDDGPVISPDGRWTVFSQDGVLWVTATAPNGRPTGASRRLTTEASDAPTWAGDSNTVLYLNNGRLKTVTLAGRTTDVPQDLTFQRDNQTGRKVIHAGKLWDGRDPTPRENVDIVVVDGRIVAIEPHRDRPRRAGWTYVDASKYTVTPGLIDMHNHQQIKAKSFGDRQGRLLLSYGITTTRSTGDPAYRSVEDREALDSGARLGPRLFATGEMLEGPQVGWDFARPVRTEQQLELEWTRVRELGYDLVKTYETFPVKWQAAVARKAHKLGVPTTSHYLYPAVGHGVDMKEHIAGPSKWGFGFARDSSLGGPYQDVLQLAGQSKMPFSTTIFAASSLLADDPGLVTDPRVRALFTPQDKQVLNAKLLCAQGRGPCGFLDGNAEQARRQVQVVKKIVDAGGVILAGTDAPLDTTALALHLNLRALAKYGLSPFQAFQSATLLSARQLGVEADLGSVEVGKLADLSFVEGDPSKDVGVLANVRSVLKHGRLFTVDELLGPFRG